MHTILADLGDLLIALLRKEMVPDIIPTPNAIGQCSPADRENVSLGLYLYDIRESETVRINGLQAVGDGQQTFPPMYLDLYYMLTAYSMSDSRFRASEEQRILGRVMQIFRDNPGFSLETMSFEPTTSKKTVRIEMFPLEGTEKVKLWNNPNLPYRLSLFYKVSPVPLYSARSFPVKRVKTVDISVNEK